MIGIHSKEFICGYWDMKVLNPIVLNSAKIFALWNGREVQVQVTTASLQDYDC